MTGVTGVIWHGSCSGLTGGASVKQQVAPHQVLLYHMLLCVTCSADSDSCNAPSRWGTCGSVSCKQLSAANG